MLIVQNLDYFPSNWKKGLPDLIETDYRPVPILLKNVMLSIIHICPIRYNKIVALIVIVNISEVFLYLIFS